MLYNVVVNGETIGQLYAWERPVSLDVQLCLVTTKVGEFTWKAYEYPVAA